MAAANPNTESLATGGAAIVQATRGVARLVHGVPASDGAGVRLTRYIGTTQIDQLDPFLLLDELRSDRPGDYLAGFPAHPHRGFETLTYLIAGRMRHRDNHGGVGLLEAGGAAWMSAGRGIVHSEMPEQADGLLWGFQLWINLPARDKLAAPRWRDLAPAELPEFELASGVRARVVAGELAGRAGPMVGGATEPCFFDLRLAPGAHALVPVPAGHHAFLCVCQGSAVVGGSRPRRVLAHELAVLLPGDEVALAAEAGGARVLLVAARPLREPVARYGPFVMNTRDELMQAVADYQHGRL